MLKFFANAALLALFGILAGCTADWDPARQARLGAATHHPQALNGALRSGATMFSAGARSSGFAALPDRGELAVYDPGSKPRVSGAYSAYPVHLSEEHALKAAYAGGHMVIRAPDGKTIMLAYERHIEHPDGNWTWIGRDAQGADAVITFGEEAAFGTIPQVDEESLRLTMSGGQTWLVATDRSKLPASDRALTRSGKDDYLIPPKMAAGAALNKASVVASPQAASAAIAPAAATTVDVVLGYTTGLAAFLGGDSQAVTRLNNLVEIGNQAYANSGVNATLRLVGTVSVNFTDASDNGDTLEKLTGYKDGTGPITPDPAFAALRAARDTHGADLVSLVRDFRTPQNNGCGIAWLIGGGQTGIDQGDAPFGYSVVSDGSDIDEADGQTYFCRDESMVHELGHNMGQAHNSEDSSGTSGVHAYSYGYRETSSNGFYTVMAYRLSGSNQFAIRHFANPSVNYDGRPTGVANSADNTRSLNQVIPTIATFRNAVAPGAPLQNLIDAGAYDINGDNKADLLWRFDAKTDWAYWTMNGGAKLGGAGYSVGPDWSVVATGDFRADGRLDLIWTNGVQLQMWEGTAAGFGGAVMRDYPTGWRVVAVGDVDADGRSDLLWRDDAATYLSLWLMNGPAIVGSSAYSVPPSWRVLGSGDLTGDNRLDVIWTDGVSMQLWIGSTQGFSGATMPGYPAGWDLVGVGDVDGDSKDDLLWRYPPTGQVAYWRMSGAIKLAGTAFSPSASWRPIQLADYTGDEKADVVWTDGLSMQLWVSTGNGFSGVGMPNYPTSWSLIRR